MKKKVARSGVKVVSHLQVLSLNLSHLLGCLSVSWVVDVAFFPGHSRGLSRRQARHLIPGQQRQQRLRRSPPRCTPTRLRRFQQSVLSLCHLVGGGPGRVPSIPRSPDNLQKKKARNFIKRSVEKSISRGARLTRRRNRRPTCPSSPGSSAWRDFF